MVGGPEYEKQNLEHEHVQETLRILKERAAQNFPGAKFVSVYSHEEKRMVTVPIHLALSSPFSHAIDYGSGVFEGGSAMMNERTGIPHVILHQQRAHRMFDRSLPSRDYRSPVSLENFAQATLDLVALHDETIFTHPNPKKRMNGFVRAYVRQTMQPSSLGGYGVHMKDNYPIDAGIIAWAWPDYLDPIIATQGGIAAITGHQRLFEITGKNASNYGAAVKDGNLARTLKTHELIYLAPFRVDKNGREYWADPHNLDVALRDGAISDGPGEECVAISADQKTLIYTSMKTNRLGGTTLQYIIDHLAKNIGLKTKEGNITLHDLRAGKYVALAMIGNAVKVSPMRQVNLHKGEKLVEQIELFEKNNIPEMLQTLMNRWDQETRGLIDPSHPSLTTPVR